MNDDTWIQGFPVIQYGDWVSCPDGLGFVQAVRNGLVKCYIQSFGVRWYLIEEVTLRQRDQEVSP